MLILPIKKKWFDMIRSGEKKEEYREIKAYYFSRFKTLPLYEFREDKMIFEVVFRNGYSKSSPALKCKCKIRIGQGKEEWGAEINKEYYILEILEVQDV